MMPETQTEHNKLSKKHIIIAVLICVLAVLSIPTLLGPFLLVPIAFAYPIIVGKRKLRWIPISMAGFCSIVMLYMWMDDFGVALTALGFFALVCAFGVGAGSLIRRFHASRKRVKILTTTVGIIILLIPCLFVLEFFTGLLRSL